jgi:hypothetical protein
MNELPMPKEGTVFQRMKYVRDGEAQINSIRNKSETGEEIGLFLDNINQALHEADQAQEGDTIVHPDRASMCYKYFTILTMRQVLVKLVNGLKDVDKNPA